MLLIEALNLIENNNLIKPYIDIMPKRNKRTKLLYLDSLSRMGYILYFDDKERCSLEILEVISKIDFNGDYNYWGYVEESISLLAFILNKQDEILSLRKIILKTLDFGTESTISINKNVHNRFLSGCTLSNNIREIENADNDILATEYRLSYLSTLLKLKLFINDTVFSNDDINNRINEQIALIKEFIKENGISKLFPFSVR